MPKPSIEIGATYGDMLCVEKVASRRKHARFRVRCIVCGREKEVYGTNLKSGEGTDHKTSCKPDLLEVGGQYDDMVVVRREANKGHMQQYTVKCQVCGREKLVFAEQMQRHEGTLHRWCVYQVHCDDKAFHERWQDMRNRTNPNLDSKKNACYKKHNISSDAFKNFIDFYDAMYESYVKHVEEYGVHDTTLDRINPLGDYTPENCRWATRTEQVVNKLPRSK